MPKHARVIDSSESEQSPESELENETLRDDVLILSEAEHSGSEVSKDDDSEPIISKRRTNSPKGRPPKRLKHSSQTSKFLTGGNRSGDEDSDTRVEGFIVDDDEELILDSDSNSGSGSKPPKRSSKVKKKKETCKQGKESTLKKKKKKPLEKESLTESSEDDLEILGEKTVFKERFRSTQKFDKFAALRAHRENRNKHQSILDSDEEQIKTTRVIRNKKWAGASDFSQSESEESEEEPPLGRPTKQQSKSKRNSNTLRVDSSDEKDEDEELESFLVDEGDENEEVNQMLDQMRTQKAGIELQVKTYIQWLIYEIICYDLDWFSQRRQFKSAFEYVNKEINSVSDSLSSSIWTPEFTRRLSRYPKVVTYKTSMYICAECQACRKEMSTTSEISISGLLYHPKNFGGIDFDEDDPWPQDGSSEDEIKRASDSVFKFSLGTHCLKMALAYHKVKHWGYHTFQSTARELERIRKKYASEPSQQMLQGLDKNQRREKKKEWRNQLLDKQIIDAKRCEDILDKQGYMSNAVEAFLNLRRTALELIAKDEKEKPQIGSRR